MGRSAWVTILAVASLSCGAAPTPCAAQAPARPRADRAVTRARFLLPATAAVAARLDRAQLGNPPARPVPRPAPTVSPSGDLMATAELDPAPLEPTELPLPINLATALRLSDARPLIVDAAQASIWVAEARLTRAKVLWIPWLTIGFDYVRHDGGGPDFNKGIMTAPSVNFFYGGTGMWQMLNLTDAYFEPLVARRELDSKHWDLQRAKNDALLQTANHYFEVHRSRGKYTATLYCISRGHELIGRIAALSRDLVPRFEVDRARNFVADLEQRATSARQAWRTHSADLTQVLRLDPRAVVVPLEHDHLQVTLIDPARTLDDLMEVALRNRPELASRRALLDAAEARVRREKMRPLLPNVLIGGLSSPNEQLQAGIFGLGQNKSLNQWRGRDDLSYQLIWQLEGFGIGNLARIKKQRGDQSRAVIDLFRTQDRVAAEVTRAHAELQSAAARVMQAERSLREAMITFNGNLEGLRQTERFADELVLINRPQEAVFALQLMWISFDEYFTTVAEYNRAGFYLFHALGYPAQEVAVLHPPGEVGPVDTARPAYLPPVMHGPPPAAR